MMPSGGPGCMPTDAGADVIFPEALRDRSEYEAFPRAVDLPLMVNLMSSAPPHR